ncbi:hypothetical protein C1H46_041322 [Malus baccata]|uniref:Uncharacterized protein n=1 Tax=Malus baccata TaxID=106549 RepID=A0A540KFY3_MALBA|nr:hypothetical protein C1H46_041322 [Malus baccata]
MEASPKMVRLLFVAGKNGTESEGKLRLETKKKRTHKRNGRDECIAVNPNAETFSGK